MRKLRKSIVDNYEMDFVDCDLYYPDLPEELDPYIFGIYGRGPCVMVTLETDFLENLRNGKLDAYEDAMPCKLLKTLKYRIFEDHVIVDGPPYEEWEKYDEPELF